MNRAEHLLLPSLAVAYIADWHLEERMSKKSFEPVMNYL